MSVWTNISASGCRHLTETYGEDASKRAEYYADPESYPAHGSASKLSAGQVSRDGWPDVALSSIWAMSFMSCSLAVTFYPLLALRFNCRKVADFEVLKGHNPQQRRTQ